ncbi:hypothetical protein TNCV_2404511 [Trichonephila clavipes]|nr:hypothetical protein TNCV_2404511 [Trichonephila clavipes]
MTRISSSSPTQMNGTDAVHEAVLPMSNGKSNAQHSFHFKLSAHLPNWCSNLSFFITRSDLWAWQPKGIGSRLTCHEFEPSTTKDSPCRDPMSVKYVEAQTSSR